MTQSSLHKPSALQLFLRRVRKLVAPPQSEGKLKSMEPKEIFNRIFLENAWKGRESVSGKGSDRDQTQSLVTELPKLFSKYGVCSVLDVPCGGFHWMQQVDLSGVRYVGGDLFICSWLPLVYPRRSIVSLRDAPKMMESIQTKQCVCGASQICEIRCRDDLAMRTS